MSTQTPETDAAAFDGRTHERAILDAIGLFRYGDAALRRPLSLVPRGGFALGPGGRLLLRWEVHAGLHVGCLDVYGATRVAPPGDTPVEPVPWWHVACHPALLAPALRCLTETEPPGG